MKKTADGEANRYQERIERVGKRRRGILFLLIILLILLGLFLAGAGIYFLQRKGQEKAYFDYMESANKYLTQMNYEEAEIAYLKAIEAEPGRVEAYTRLSAIYVAQERWDEAKKLLVRGINMTDSDVLVKTYQRVMLTLENPEEAVEAMGSAVDVEAVSADVTVDATIFDITASYSYTDYVQHYGSPVSVTGNVQGGCDLKFDGYAGTLSYYNTPEDSYIYDASANLPYATRKPNEVRFNNLSDIFGNYQGAVSGQRLEELFGAGVRVEEGQEGESRFAVVTWHRCTLRVECDENGNIIGNAANSLVPFSDQEIEEESDEGNQVSGYLVNVLNGGGVRATMRFLKDGRYGTPEGEVDSRYDGSFEVRLAAGKYTVEIRAAGFIPSYEEIEVLENRELTGLNFNLSPSLSVGEIRIVLTWGATPYDLDSHLIGTASTGSSVHVSFMNLQIPDVAKLDLDDRMSYGPETTTIYDSDGSYTFSVHDFTNGNNRNSAQLSQSGATVTIYLPDGAQPVVYTVPAGTGTHWTVCRIENGQVTPVNTME